MRLTFDRGTLVLHGAEACPGLLLPEAQDDPRVGAIRVPAHHYHLVVRSLVAQGRAFEDQARGYQELDLSAHPAPPEPRPYQGQALAAWRAARRRGVVVLPTGTGKTLVAVLAIRETRRSALVVVPTLDLLHQWHALLAAHFGGEAAIGAMGGGEVRPTEITVTTYDSAYLHLDRLGNRFGLVVFDEVHHLAGPAFQDAARMSLAPFRLGLTATPGDEEDPRWTRVTELLGPVVYRREITEMAGEWLSPYETRRVVVELPPVERAAYEAARARFRAFVDQAGIRLGAPGGWGRFLEASSRSAEGREALLAWREQRRLALAAPRKLEELAAILERHRDERLIVFTHDNETVFAVSRRFLVPAITHRTKGPERRAMLAGLRDGTTPVLCTSRVLNEGVDLPAVGVAVVLSGSGTVREHVQRLGRILRPAPGKRALLYELISAGTSEEATSARRREHDAYR